MTEEFNQNYLSLLRNQVDEEIAYLVRNGHDTNKIYMPCMFCLPTRDQHYICNRLKELRQFQSSIISNQGLQRRTQHERKRIGFEQVNTSLNKHQEGVYDIGINQPLPLLNSNF